MADLGAICCGVTLATWIAITAPREPPVEKPADKASAGAAGEQQDLPPEAKSIEEIVTAVEHHKGFGTPASVHHRRPSRELFGIWYCPYSGRDATKLHLYQFDPARKRWTLVLDTRFEHTHDLSLELPPGDAGFVVRDVRGKVIYRERSAK